MSATTPAVVGADYLVATPLWLDGVEKRTPAPAPTPGEHNEEVLRDIGFGEEEIAWLRSTGAIPS